MVLIACSITTLFVWLLSICCKTYYPCNYSIFHYSVKIGKVNCLEGVRCADVKHRPNCIICCMYFVCHLMHKIVPGWVIIILWSKEFCIHRFFCIFLIVTTAWCIYCVCPVWISVVNLLAVNHIWGRTIFDTKKKSWAFWSEITVLVSSASDQVYLFGGMLFM